MLPMTAAITTLWWREMVRFGRQRNRVIGALATPVVFWLLLGFGVGDAFSPGSGPGLGEAGPAKVGYLEYFYPGVMVMILLFTAIFSTISVIEDRREGFLQGVLVAPVSRASIVLGKVLGGASVAVIQGVLFLAAWPFVTGAWPGVGTLVAAIAVMMVLAVALVALGLCLAWPMDSTAGFHAVMNLLLMPMWFLCGAVFPVATAPFWMRVVMYANPLTYGYSVFAQALGGGQAAVQHVPMAVALPVMLALTVGAVALATRVARRPRKDGT